jgi:hypothetical protein
LIPNVSSSYMCDMSCLEFYVFVNSLYHHMGEKNVWYCDMVWDIMEMSCDIWWIKVGVGPYIWDGCHVTAHIIDFKNFFNFILFI